MIPFKTSFESTPTLRSSRHSLSNFSGVSLLRMLKQGGEKKSKYNYNFQLISDDIFGEGIVNNQQDRSKDDAKAALPPHFSEDCIFLLFPIIGARISSSASRRDPSLNARTWGLPQGLAVITNTKQSSCYSTLFI